MNEKNPYASPSPTDEDLEKPASPIPQSFRQALLQGLKLGFKWGNRVWLTIFGLCFLVFVGANVYKASVLEDPSRIFHPNILWELVMGFASLVFFYVYLCVITIVVALVISSSVYGVRKLFKLIRCI